MIAESWFAIDSPLGVSMMANMMFRRTSYRLHEIVIGLEGRGAVATVYDGTGPVQRFSGFNEVDALSRAHQWIDEQDESLPAYDLHAG